jgi:hypothetical protein
MIRALALSLILLLAACASGNDALMARLTVLNSSAAVAAAGLTTAVKTGAIERGSDTARAIGGTLGSIELALDAAGAYVRAGMPDKAEASLDAAQGQIKTLQSFTGGNP